MCKKLACLLMIVFGLTVHAQQIADPHFNVKVENPTFTKNFPRVLFDEAHNNFDNPNNRYKPFADLIFNDGYHIALNRQPFTKESLASYKILIIINPLGAEDSDDEGADGPAFTAEECNAVNDWLRGGGALLLIADATPFSSAAEVLATKLGVEMSKGPAADPANSTKEGNEAGVIVYSRENHLLGENGITSGRNDAEKLNRIVVFGGQSLKGPSGSEAFLRLSDTATADVSDAEKKLSAAGRAQGIAFRVNRGRVVVLGDAAMLSAQLTGSDNEPVGMNVPNVDNRQLALNIMHWLSGVLK
jgi:hypothetical protein